MHSLWLPGGLAPPGLVISSGRKSLYERHTASTEAYSVKMLWVLYLLGCSYLLGYVIESVAIVTSRLLICQRSITFRYFIGQNLFAARLFCR